MDSNTYFMRKTQIKIILHELAVNEISKEDKKMIQDELKKAILNSSTNIESVKEFANLFLDACYDDTELSAIPTSTIDKEIQYDLNSFCNVIQVNKNTSEYKSIKSKMSYDRNNGNLNCSKNNGGKKYYYSYTTLLNYTKTQMPQFYEIFKSSK